MAKFNKSIAPYYDKYDSSKQYTHLLAVPGRVAQAREITEIQTTVKDIVKSIGDSIFKDGNIVEGCQVLVSEDKKYVTITSGRVYINGMVLPVEERKLYDNPNEEGYGKDTRIPIKGVGTEIIGFKLMETLITEDEDNSLLDPAQGYDNFSQAGCHRIKSWVDIVVDDKDSVILSTLIDGSVSVEKYAPEYDVLTQTLATRTKEESGSYIVNGFNTRVAENINNPEEVNVVVEAGLAYINGYRLNVPSARSLPTRRSLDTLLVKRNTTYSGGDYTLTPTGEYVQNIINVEGIIQSNTIMMSAPSHNGASQPISLPANAVEFYDFVAVSSTGTSNPEEANYIKGTDYEVEIPGDSNKPYIKWKGTSNYPTGTYYIVCLYRTKFVQGTDYELISMNGAHHLHWIDGGSSPEVGLLLYVEFNLYLARRDIVYMNQKGDIDIIKGIPAQYGLEAFPESPTDTLTLARIMHPPGGTYSQVQVSNVALTRFTMNDIQNLLNRIRTIEYNQTISSLQDDTRQRVVSGTRKSIFTDPLIDFSKIDYYYNLVDASIKYDATIDFNSNICYLPVVNNTYDLSYNSSSESTVKKYNRLVTLSTKSGEESIILSQTKATKSFLINPYERFPQIPEISLTPAVDSWIEDSIITVPVSQTSSEVVSSSTRHIENAVTSWNWNAIGTTTTSTFKDTAIGTRVTTDTQESVINEQSITYIRSREITVEGNGFPSNLDNIRCYIEGIQIPIYPIGSTTTSTETATSAIPSIKASASGTISAKFTIPEGTFLTGIREVKLATAVPGYGIEGSAFALYQASGTSRTIQRTVSTLTTILLNRVTTITTTTTNFVNFLDPVGQTFVLDRMTLIKGIDLYFASVPASNIPVTCEIRGVENGTITPTVLGHKTLSANEVRPNISSDSNKATRFTFDDPVLLEGNKEYAFVVRSSSTEYRIWVAELGENDIITGETVVSNPYLIGAMMSSSNNSSWTTHQTTDVKFRLVADKYTNSSELIFDSITSVEEFSRVYLIADSFIPEGSSVTWSYKLSEAEEYKPISPYNILLLKSMNDYIRIKATLTRSNSMSENLSPMIAIDSISTTLSSFDQDGYYVSLEFPGNSYNTVDIILDTYIPYSDEFIKVYVSADNGVTRKEATITNSEHLNYGWIENTYKVAMNESSENCKVIIQMHSNNKYETPAFSRLRAITYTE